MPPDDGNDDKTDVSNISIPETKFEAPDINDSIFNSLKDAILTANDGFDGYITVSEEKYGRLFVDICHHDGNNRLEIRGILLEFLDQGAHLDSLRPGTENDQNPFHM